LSRDLVYEERKRKRQKSGSGQGYTFRDGSGRLDERLSLLGSRHQSLCGKMQKLNGYSFAQQLRLTRRKFFVVHSLSGIGKT
jgi:hypothetical protein